MDFADNPLEQEHEDFLSLRSNTDQLIKEYLNPTWLATLPFPSCCICTKDEVYDSKHASTLDLFLYCKGGVNSTLYKGLIIRFDTATYPIPTDPKQWWETKLLTDIITASHDYGKCKFISNGSNGYGKAARKICCNRCSPYSKRNAKVINDSPLVLPGQIEQQKQQMGLRNCKKSKVKSNSRNTTTSKPINKEETCKVCLIIRVDNHSYYMIIGSGEGLHTNHCPLDVSFATKRKRLVSAECMLDIAKQGYFKVKVGSAVHLSQEQHDCNLSRRQIQSYMNFGHLATSIHDLNLIDNNATPLSDPERMLSFFERTGIPYLILSHNIEEAHHEFPGQALKIRNRHKTKDNNCNADITDACPSKQQSIVVMETFGLDDTGSAEELCDQGNQLQECISNIINEGDDHRIASGMTTTQSLMLSFIWCLPHCRRIFQAFPEVIFIDGTHATNNSRLPLFTVGVRDEKMNVIVVIRAFVPNEKAWMFRWLFQQAIPTIIGKKTCNRINLILTDGDSQEYSQLDAAIMSGIYGKAVRRRCGWHIIEKGASLNLSGYAKDIEMQKVIRLTKYWVQESLMKGAETLEEYQVSKQLLFDVINKLLGQRPNGVEKANRIHHFLRQYVYPLEEYFAAYRYKFVHAFEEYCNNPLEGTNSSLKHSDYGVNGNMPLHKSAAFMIQQDKDRLLRKKRELQVQLHNKQCCDVNNATIEHLNRKAYGELVNQLNQSHYYISLRTQNSWLVRRSSDRSSAVKSTIIPIFQRFRIVTLNGHNALDCDCGYKQRWGIPCRHIAHVAKYYSIDQCRFTHKDVDVRWWNIYAKLVGVEDPSEMNERDLLLRNNLLMIQRQQHGTYPLVNLHPFHGIVYSAGSGSAPHFIGLSTDEGKQYFLQFKTTILNYPDAAVQCTTNHHTGLSQTIHLSQDGDDDGNSLGAHFGNPDQENEYPVIDDGNQQERLQYLCGQLNFDTNGKMRPFECMNPLFKEFIAVLDSGTTAHTKLAYDMVYKAMLEIKQQIMKDAKTPIGTVVAMVPGVVNQPRGNYIHPTQSFLN